MSTVKRVVGLIAFAGTETTYGEGASLTGSLHTIQCAQEFPTFQIQYASDGQRGGANWSGGNVRPVGPSGRTTQGTVIMEGKGAGTAYSLSVTPPSLHPFLLASGLSGSLSASAWVYKPVSLDTVPKSLAMNVYGQGELLPISGAYCAMTFAADNPSVTLFNFDVQGLCGDVTDVAVPPARTFPAHEVQAPRNQSVSFAMGAYVTARIRSYTYEHGLEITPRINLNSSTGHAGFVQGRRKPVFNIVVEADDLASFDPYLAWKNATTYAMSLTVGSVANNRFSINFDQAVITGCERSSDGPLALWNLQVTPYVSIPDADDDLRLVFN